MIISVLKCNVVLFSRSHEVINFKYTIEDQILSRVTVIKDLGVIFDSRLTFKPHLNNVISRANRNLYFICRHTMDFRNVNSLKILYLSLVRSILTYSEMDIFWNKIKNSEKFYPPVQFFAIFSAKFGPNGLHFGAKCWSRCQYKCALDFSHLDKFWARYKFVCALY